MFANDVQIFNPPTSGAENLVTTLSTQPSMLSEFMKNRFACTMTPQRILCFSYSLEGWVKVLLPREIELAKLAHLMGTKPSFPAALEEVKAEDKEHGYPLNSIIPEIGHKLPEDSFFRDHLAADPGENERPNKDNNRITLHESGKKGCGKENDGDGDENAEDKQAVVPARGPGNSQDVIHAH